MEALQVFAPGHVGIVDIPRPHAEADEILVTMEAVCTCPRWDITLFDGIELFEGTPHTYPQLPGVPGHEGAGIIAEVGAGVDRWQVGDHVAVWQPSYPGGQGLYAPLASVRAEGAVKLKDDTSFALASPFEMLVDVLYAVEKLGDIHGLSIAVTGLGPAGLLAAQIAHAFGADQVLALEPSAHRREYAAGKLPWLHLLPAPGDDMVGVVDHGVECAGAARATEALMQVARDQVIQFGVPHGRMQWRTRDWGREVVLKGVSIGRITQADVALGRDMLEAGQIDTGLLLTHEGSLHRYSESVALLRSGEAIKVLFHPASELRA